MPLLIAKQGSPEWYAARKGRITASIAPCILGLDERRGPFSAWQEIMGRHKQSDNAFMAWGRKNEARARTEYQNESGYKVQETGFWLHHSLPWLGASPDGLCDANGLAEIKCPSNIPEEIDPRHDCQMRVQLACTDREWCDYFCWHPDGYFLARVYRDPQKEKAILDGLRAFYEQHVLTEAAPPRRRRKTA